MARQSQREGELRYAQIAELTSDDGFNPRRVIDEEALAELTESVRLEPKLSKREVRPLVNSARRHWRATKRNTLMFCAELRQLQDGGAHLTYGFSEFGEWAAGEFEELSPAQARTLANQGSILLALDAEGHIQLDGKLALPIGTTGVRALAGVPDKRMRGQVFDLARQRHPTKTLAAADIKEAQRELLPPPAARQRPERRQPEPEESPLERVLASTPERLDPADLPAELADHVEGLRELRTDVEDWSRVPHEEAQQRLKELERELVSLRKLLGATR